MDEPLDPDKPYKYSTSDARYHSSLDTFAPVPKNPPPWYQRYSITISMAVFLVYFGILREENDLDAALYEASPVLKDLEKTNNR